MYTKYTLKYILRCLAIVYLQAFTLLEKQMRLLTMIKKYQLVILEMRMNSSVLVWIDGIVKKVIRAVKCLFRENWRLSPMNLVFDKKWKKFLFICLAYFNTVYRYTQLLFLSIGVSFGHLTFSKKNIITVSVRFNQTILLYFDFSFKHSVCLFMFNLTGNMFYALHWTYKHILRTNHGFYQ